MALLLQNREASNSTLSSGRRGWVSSPDMRGTIAIALVLWTMLHLNVPGPSDSEKTMICRRLRWLLVGLLAPELILMYSFAQFTSDWTLVHSFYADRGGFQLHVPNYKPFPITAKQVVYLTEHGHIDMPTITKREINDKSKANRETKVLAFLQTGWLVTKLIARAGQGLQITPYELTTLALLVCSFTTLVLWWHKPLDVRYPTPIHLKDDLKIILDKAGVTGEQCFTNTPLDFIEGNIYWSRKAHESFLHFVLKWSYQTFPIDRIPNDRDYQPRNIKQNLYLVLPSLKLWGGYTKKMPTCFIFLSLRTIYFISRIIILVESVISLKDLPEAAYKEVNWTQYLPRI
ncbi:hypothetical protein F4825DRAFT_467574 [Nemania diffusa]|nr:hypothetical protein F4825DRAFT_467574 [Nemania diffusa]